MEKIRLYPNIPNWDGGDLIGDAVMQVARDVSRTRDNIILIRLSEKLGIPIMEIPIDDIKRKLEKRLLPEGAIMIYYDGKPFIKFLSPKREDRIEDGNVIMSCILEYELLEEDEQ